MAQCLDRFASPRLTSPQLTCQTIWTGLEPAAAMTTTEIRDVPKEQIFGPMAMDRGCLRASEAWMKGASEFGTAGIGAGPQLHPRAPRLCQMVPEGFYCDAGPHLPCVLQAAGGSCSLLQSR